MCLIPLNCNNPHLHSSFQLWDTTSYRDFQRNLAFIFFNITGWKHGRGDENNKQSRGNICTFILKCIPRPCKNVSSGLCRPSLGVLLLWPTQGSAGVSASPLLVLMAWKDTQVHKHSSIFSPANLLHEPGTYLPLWIFQQTKTRDCEK